MLIASRLIRGDESIYVHPSKVERLLRDGWALYGEPPKAKPKQKKKRGRKKNRPSLS